MIFQPRDGDGSRLARYDGTLFHVYDTVGVQAVAIMDGRLFVLAYDCMLAGFVTLKLW